MAISAISAAEAIEKARRAYQGRTVLSCYSGLKEADCVFLRQMDKDAKPIVGWVDHDVPPHEPIPAGTSFKREKHEDATGLMFNDEAIKSESARALTKHSAL